MPVSTIGAAILAPRELLGEIASARARGFTLLSLLTAVDTGESLEMVYVLVRPSDRERIAFKVPLPYGSPRVPTLSDTWAGAEWLEREVYDLFGVEFEGHPYMRRIFLADDFDGHPLLKSYTRKGAPYIPSREV
jgi:NADH-quinone oxidoreductase subunit C